MPHENMPLWNPLAKSQAQQSLSPKVGFGRNFHMLGCSLPSIDPHQWWVLMPRAWKSSRILSPCCWNVAYLTPSFSISLSISLLFVIFLIIKGQWKHCFDLFMSLQKASRISTFLSPFLHACFSSVRRFRNFFFFSCYKDCGIVYFPFLAIKLLWEWREYIQYQRLSTVKKLINGKSNFLYGKVIARSMYVRN